MTDANYILHFKTLGKYAYIYDTSTADAAAMNTALATTLDQIATGTTASADAEASFCLSRPNVVTAIASGSTAIQAQMVTLGQAFLKTSQFIDTFASETPTTSDTVATIATALAAEMTTDAKTLTTESATGLINFLEACSGNSPTWNESGTPDYADATYVVSAVVA
jgi:hypothetical protein